MLPKPQGCESGGDTQDKNCGNGTDKLAEESHGKHVWVGCSCLDPGPDAVEGCAHHHYVPEASVVEHPHDWQDDGDVGEEEDHGEPVNGQGVNVVKPHYDVAYDAVLQPHEGIAHGVSTEDE